MSCLLLLWSTFAGERNIPWIEIIKRNERWAIESRWHISSGRFDGVYEKNDAYEQRLQTWWDNPAFEKRKEREEIQAARTSFLATQYPADIAVDKTVYTEWGKDLVRPEQIVYKKKKIIIHHTADAYDYHTNHDVETALDDFYELHTLKHWRGDIGYNFLIDPFGNVYEGRDGWQWTVWAHTDWNNTSTIWIALMGNFEHDHPTPIMLRSLVRMWVSLWYSYGIWPATEQPYFTAIAKAPYFDVSYHDSIVWHKDTKVTACPWEHLYELIPEIKRQITAQMDWLARHWVQRITDARFKTIKKPFVAEWTETVLWLPAMNNSDEVSCTSFNENILLWGCYRLGDKIIVPVSYQWVWSSWYHTIWVGQWTDAALYDVWLLWKNELDDSLVDKKAERNAQYASDENKQPTKRNKSVSVITLDKAIQASQKDISVLLYELTTEYDSREFRCAWSCLAILNNERFPNPWVVTIVRAEWWWLNAYINQQQHSVESFGITSPWLIEIVNYDRAVGEYALNTFRWSLTFTQSGYYHLEEWEKQWRVMINTLPFSDYMAWIGESSNLQHPEKTKTLALLSKQYALWYLAWENRHPSIPEGVWYTAIDDPRSFQKYVWAWREWYSPQRQEIVKSVENTYVSYNNELPILPYFHCSWWFTRSWQEKRWRTDTPRLQSTRDVIACESWQFEWHGVGLSGDWAERMAQAWVSMEEIVQWYYDGVEVVEG